MERRFIIEFCVEYDNTPPPITDVPNYRKWLKRKADSVGELAIRNYLERDPNSPLHRYSFDRAYRVENLWLDGFPLREETEQIMGIIQSINSLISAEDRVVIHIWGHANIEVVGCTSYGTLFDSLHTINCAHLYINLMNSCYTCGAKEYGDDLTTIWYTTRGADNASHDDFDPLYDDPMEYSLSERAKNEFDIPFLIYESWDDRNSKYDFSTFLIKVREKGGMTDLYETTD